MCNVLYKIISKLLANRLKQILPKLISPWQTAFVPSRKIQENTFLAQEILHDMRKKRGKKGWMGLKIDMEKAYDRLELCFFRESSSSHWFSKHLDTVGYVMCNYNFFLNFNQWQSIQLFQA